MDIRKATLDDLDMIAANDIWIGRDILQKKIADGQVYAAYDKREFIGWLRYGMFWDNTPFMNMLFLLEQYRRKGFGRQLVSFWENDMRKNGHKLALTSSAQTEYAQHFYNKLGYKAIGSFMLANEPLEVILAKPI